MHTGRGSKGIKYKGKITHVAFCFPVLSTTKQKKTQSAFIQSDTGFDLGVGAEGKSCAWA